MAINTYLTEEEREKLSSVRIGIAGAGGLGSNCAMHLVRAGVRHLVIADFDTVSEANMNRQFFFRDQIGRKKVEALEDNLRRIEPELKLDMRDIKLDKSNTKQTFSGCDIIVEALDVAKEKSMLLHALLPLGKPIIAASGIAGWGNSLDVSLRRIGKNLVLIGDTTSDIASGLAPQSPRVGIAAAMQANAVIATILGHKL